jgi:hypothetical protein
MQDESITGKVVINMVLAENYKEDYLPIIATKKKNKK